ncbi:AcrB/AcrD/AcrF family protein [bacterium (Candidatus Blackallbacteria) CG17_big_fil_post_rev_8_21_14_2_50_48_46]|uniref:AcrB/AcrD/AcrF family protein n=1 Tax=bacterium (Candidatus Blackallbacteria) CG17_big_fil_post_rev_8_21_14_2_50_48_46 TaxID=2014261 RepID=A0A2M7G5D4_9BACT|nr:MAG: acriflavin resistance protein [bacterium (Candidatus Blackallbacteria) CG18_big_fil_WC_8_21_14_2_50_49_26]PIW16773.1 MAG: AcrB/AcrD/AcrF family protein [bacterium (Candidatus Blackallbacteria) CG17_big_fil_post_rev_8_21_14_2_50_48_46]PIW49565.1 MAG: AcrB/AcrD/AcrF family protein [bacterium (Candidatus Blackallbacteria) CG13_big_fil_rev_8_21_14_2_50_49_14]
MKITNWAIRNATTVFILIFITVMLGLNSYMSVPKEAAPDVKIPILIVTVPYIGVASQDIETLVTVPIEKKLKELSNVRSIKSTSAEGASMTTIEFEPNVDLDQAFQKVRDKVDLAKPDLPKDAEEPMIIEINISEFPIMFVNVSGEAGLVKLKQIADELEDEIEQVTGVLDVNVVGGLKREIKVIVDSNRLDAYGLAFNDVITAIQTENVNIPGGSIQLGNVKYLVRIPGEFTSVPEIENIVVKTPKGQPIYMRDIAKVVDGYKDRETYARLNGEESVSISVQKRIGENIIQLSDAVKKIVEKKQTQVPKGIQIVITSDQSTFVRSIVSDLENNIITGLLLVILVLFFAMGFSNATFVSLAIPLSMLMTFVVIEALGLTMNMIVLFSLVVSLGMIVDNAIVIVESIYRLMQEGMDRLAAAKQAAEELGIPMLTSTLTTLAAFFPLLFWPGTIGDFMKYLPMVLMITLSASLFVATVINPVFAARFMKVRKGDVKENLEQLSPWMQTYKNILLVAVRHKYLTLGVGLVFLISSFVVYGKLGKGAIFFSQAEPSNAFVSVKCPEGTRVEVTNRIVEQVEAIVNKHKKNMDFVIASVGSANQSEGPGGGGGEGSYSHLGRVSIDFVDLQKRTRSSKVVLDEIRDELKTLTGADFEVGEQQQGPPTGAPVSIDISGPDFAVLEQLRQEVREILTGIPGAVDVRDNFSTGKPEVQVNVDRAKASLVKLSTSSIANTVRTAVNGTDASNFRELDEEYDIIVRLEEDQRHSIEDIGRLKIANKDGDQIPISMVANIDTTGGIGAIRRKDSNRTVTVEANVQGRVSGEVIADVEKILKKKSLPPGYAISFGGEQEDRKATGAFLGKAFMMVLLMIFLIMVTQFNSLLLPLIIMSTIILSVGGVLYGLVITQSPFSIVLTGLAVVSLAGVVVNNGIILIDYIQLLRKGGLSAHEAVIVAGITRLRPVLLTAGTTILGLIPTALGVGIDFRTLSLSIGGESSKLWFSMAVGIISGLTFSTALTLLVVPAMYMITESMMGRFHRLQAWFGKRFRRNAEPRMAMVGGNAVDIQNVHAAHEAMRDTEQDKPDAES